MRGTIAGNRRSNGLRGLAVFLMAWAIVAAGGLTRALLAQTAGSQATEKGAGLPGSQEASGSRTPPLPATSPPDDTAKSQTPAGDVPTKAQPDGVPPKASEPGTAAKTSSQLEARKAVLRDLLAYDYAALKQDPDRKTKFKQKALERAKQMLGLNLDATLTPEDRSFVLELAYDLGDDSVVAGTSAVRRPTAQPAGAVPTPPTPAEPTRKQDAPPERQAGPTGDQGAQYAPTSEQYAPIRNALFDSLTKKLTDFGSKLDPSSSSTDIRSALQKQVTSMLGDALPPPFSIFKQPAENMLNGLVETLATKISSGDKVAPPDSTATADAKGSTAGVTGMPTLPKNSAISASVLDTLVQRLVNTKKNIFKKNADIALDQLKTRLKADAEAHLDANDVKTPLNKTDDDFINQVVDAVASPTSVIKPMLDELEKALDQLNIEALSAGVTTDRAADLLKRITAWLKDKKQINFDQLPPADQELIKDLVDKVVAKQPTGTDATNAGNVVKLVPSQGLTNTTGTVLQIGKPGCFLKRGTTFSTGTGTVVIIR
jgi:hypothetical protein